MSYDKTMEELLVSARELPTELSFNEVEFLFLNPTPPPPARLWWRGGYLKFLLMFIALVTSTLLLFNGQADVTLSLSSFPLIEVISPASVPANPITTMLTAEALTEAQRTDPTAVNKLDGLSSIPPLTFTAPAAAPKSPSSPLENKPLRSAIGTPETSRPSATPVPVWFGKYRLRDNRLELSFAETLNPTQHATWSLIVDLLPGEMSSIKSARKGPIFPLTRAAGTLMLDGRRRGTFEFVPNSGYRNQLNGTGMGDASLGPDGQVQLPVTVRVLKRELTLETNYPKEMLWLKYFAESVNEKYTALLRQQGYTSKELTELYHLPDHGINLNELEELLQLTGQLLKQRPPLAELARLGMWTPRLRIAVSQKFFDLKQEEFKAIIGDLLSTQKDREPLIGVLKLSNIFDIDTMLVESISPIIPLIVTDLPKDWGMKTPGRKSKVLHRSQLERLVVTGNVRAHIIKSKEAPQVIVFGTEAGHEALRFSKSGRRAKLRNTNSNEWIDVEVTSAQFKGIKAIKGATLVAIKTKD